MPLGYTVSQLDTWFKKGDSSYILDWLLVLIWVLLHLAFSWLKPQKVGEVQLTQITTSVIQALNVHLVNNGFELDILGSCISYHCF